LRGQFDVVWDNRSELNSTFDGVDLTLNKRFDQRWMLIAGASFGKNEGDIFGGTSDLNNPNFQFRRGIVGNQVPVSVKLSTSYQAPWGILAGAVFQHYTGFPETTSVSVGATTVPLTQVTQSIVVQPRGTTRLPDVNLLDVNIKRVFKFSDRFSAQPALEIYNLLNSNAVQSRTTVLGPAYYRAANIVFGRMVKFGLNVNF
jgi:hypothetical protein